MSDNPSSLEKQDPAEIIAMARAIGEIYDGYADPRDTPNNWHRAAAAGRAAIEALREAGYVIVPRAPTKAMIEAGDDICPIARGTETHRMAGGVVPEDYWRAMVETAGG